MREQFVQQEFGLGEVFQYAAGKGHLALVKEFLQNERFKEIPMNDSTSSLFDIPDDNFFCLEKAIYFAALNKHKDVVITILKSRENFKFSDTWKLAIVSAFKQINKEIFDLVKSYFS